MMNVSRTWKGVASVVTLLAGFISSGQAHAVSVAGAAGYPINRTSAPCFSTSGPMVHYSGNCGPSQTWTIPLTSNAGNRSVAIDGVNNSTLACFVCEENQDVSRGGCAPTTSFPLQGHSVQSATISVPTNGTLYVLCFVGSDSWVNTLNYNQ